MSAVEVLYLLKPVEAIGDGWWRLKWRPLYRQTWSVYLSHSTRGLGVRFWRSDKNNGWGSSWRQLHIETNLILVTLNFWIRWDFYCLGTGPLGLSLGPLKFK